MELENLLTKKDDPDNAFSEKRFLDRMFSRYMLEKKHDKDLSGIKWSKMLDYKYNPKIEALHSEIDALEKLKQEQSDRYRIHVEDTPAQILLRFTHEFLFILKTQESDGFIKNPSLISKINSNPELEDALLQDNDKKLETYFKVNTNFFDSLNNKLDSYEPKAKKLLDKGWDILCEGKMEEAMLFINEGIRLNDKVYNPYLFELKSNWHRDQDQLEEALESINTAIELLMEDPFYFDEGIGGFLNTRSSIKNKLGDFDGGKLDDLISYKYDYFWAAKGENISLYLINNITTSFVLPMIFKDEVKYTSEFFNGFFHSYTGDFYISENDYKLLIVKSNDEIPKGTITKPVLSYRRNKHYVFVYEIPLAFENNFSLIRENKYFELDKLYKDKLLNFWSCNEKSILYKVLFLDPTLNQFFNYNLVGNDMYREPDMEND